MKQPEHARLQNIIAEWIKSEGGRFGVTLAARQIGNESFILTVDDVAKHMATAAMATFNAIQDVTVCVGVDA
jgi:hypothetical protein